MQFGRPRGREYERLLDDGKPGMRVNGWAVAAIVAGVLALGFLTWAIIVTLVTRPPVPTRGVVSAIDPQSVRVGAEILAKGGNGIDAFIATTFASFVLQIGEISPGGGGFILIHDKETGKVITIDGRETAPAAYHPDILSGKDFDQVVFGGLGTGVPGVLRALEKAYQNGASMPWRDLVQPAIDLAENGVPLSEFSAAIFSESDEFRNHYLRRSYFWNKIARQNFPGGVPPSAGSNWKNPDLAELLKLIRDYGVDVFYKSGVAPGVDVPQAIVDAVNSVKTFDPTAPNSQVCPPGSEITTTLPGVMTKEDLANYEAIVREPIVTDYRGFKIYGMGPPTSGGLSVAYLLELVEQFPYGNRDLNFSIGQVKRHHTFSESTRPLYEDRAKWMGDSDFVKVPVEGLLDPDYLAPLKAQIDPDSIRLSSTSAGNPWPFDSQDAPSGQCYPVSQPAARRRAAGSLKKKQAKTQPQKVRADPHRRDEMPPAFLELVEAQNLVSQQARQQSTAHISVASERYTVSATWSIEGIYGAAFGVEPYGFLMNNQLTDFNFEPTCDLDSMGTTPGANDPEAGKRPRSSMAPTIVYNPTTGFIMATGAAGGPRIFEGVLQIITAVIDDGYNGDQAIEHQKWYTYGAADFGITLFEGDIWGYKPPNSWILPGNPLPMPRSEQARADMDDLGWFTLTIRQGLGGSANLGAFPTYTLYNPVTQSYAGGSSRPHDRYLGGSCQVTNVTSGDVICDFNKREYNDWCILDPDCEVGCGCSAEGGCTGI